MCKAPKMPKMPKMPPPRAAERLPNRALVTPDQRREQTGMQGGMQASGQILGNTAMTAQRRGSVASLVPGMVRGTSSATAGSSILGG